MQLTKLMLSDFRSYRELTLDLSPGLTAICGPNGVGKTNLLEAIGLLATLKSFRGAPVDSLVHKGSDRGIIRAEGLRDDRSVLIELELARGRTRAQVNRQKLRRARDLLGALRVTFFTPDDLVLVKEGPAHRRGYLDDLAVALDPGAHGLISDIDRILKQRNALLRQSHGRLDEAAEMTLDVWDAKLSDAGTGLTVQREVLVAALSPLLNNYYRLLASDSDEVGVFYERSWKAPTLAEALADGRRDDLRRSTTGVGPHRDELRCTINGLASRTEASQGEQRTLALAMRMAGHDLVAKRVGEPPLLLLDDVLSELDPERCHALLANIPPGQTVITSAGGLPTHAETDHVLLLSHDGEIRHQ